MVVFSKTPILKKDKILGNYIFDYTIMSGSYLSLSGNRVGFDKSKALD